MTDEQIKELFKWLDAQTYSGEPGTGGEYVRMEEMRKYLPGAIKKIMKKDDVVDVDWMQQAQRRAENGEW